MIDIEKLANEHLTPFVVNKKRTGWLADDEQVKQFAAKVLEDIDAEIAELTKAQLETIQIVKRKQGDISQMKAHINDLREAAENYILDGESALPALEQALSKTPAHDAVIFTKKSLQQHINDVIEICACVCAKSTSKYEAESKIRALKA